jgi:3',5'-cyclic AMP phosphodiesterase CpdA
MPRMSEAVSIAHLTDVHLGPISGFSPRYWNLKRGAGYLNWVRKRRDGHRRDVLDRIVEDMHARRPDHICVTGDLANIGLPQEHLDALAWLESVGPPERVSVVPGNHDIYSRIGRDAGTRRWHRYMESNAEGRPFVEGDGFPFVRVLGSVALVGVNSALPTPVLLAYGRIGAKQLARLEDILARLKEAGLFRLVLVHHPPLTGQASSARGLRDAPALQDVLSRAGAELVIHGHNHRNMFAWHPHGAGRMAVVGAPSASQAVHHGVEQLARYNLYRIDAAARSIGMIGLGLAEPDGGVVELERRTLSLSPQAA